MRNLSSILKVSTAMATLAFAYVAGSEHAADRMSGNPAMASVQTIAPPTTPVLVVAAAATAGTATSELALSTIDVPTGQLGPEFLPDTDDTRALLGSAHLARPVAAGAPLLRADLDSFAAPDGRSGITLGAGMVAMAVSVSPETAVAGLLNPGDRVDVISTRTLADGEAQARIVLRGCRVLAVDDRTLTPTLQAETPPATLTLELSADGAVSLSVARALGQVSVVLSTATEFAQAGPEAAAPEAADLSSADVQRGAQVRVLRAGEPFFYSVRRDE